MERKVTVANRARQNEVANFVNVLTNVSRSPRDVGRKNLEQAFAGIAALVTSDDQSDVDSGIDTLHVLTRFLDRSTQPAQGTNLDEARQRVHNADLTMRGIRTR